MRKTANIGTVFLIVFMFLPAHAQNQKKEYVHPCNQVLLKLYPRPFKLKWPSVPRILASQALTHYKAGTAFFIRIGAEGGIVPGAFYGETIHKTDPRIIKKLAGSKLIIVY